MQDYMSMALEAAEQPGGMVPTYVFLQTGVGAMAGAVAGFFCSSYQERMPRLTIVEPDRADCLFRTARANDGTLHKVGGALDSIMACLCCGEVYTIGWEVLRHQTDCFFSCPDYVAADGMRGLGNPLPESLAIVSDESGAAPAGLVYHLLQNEGLEAMKEAVGPDRSSVVLCISTERDTDWMNCRHLVWDSYYVCPRCHITMEREFMNFCDQCDSTWIGRATKKPESYTLVSVTPYIPDSLKGRVAK